MTAQEADDSNRIGLGHAFVVSRPLKPELFSDRTPSENVRAQGRPGARRPHGPRAERMHGAGTTGSAGHSRPSLRDGFHSCFAISLGTGCLAPIVGAMRFRTAIRLDLSIGRSGPRDLTVRIGSFVGATKSRCDPLRPPHPCPASRDDRAYAPHRWGRMDAIEHSFWKSEREIFCCRAERGGGDRSLWSSSLRRHGRACPGHPRHPANVDGRRCPGQARAWRATHWHAPCGRNSVWLL